MTQTGEAMSEAMSEAVRSATIADARRWAGALVLRGTVLLCLGALAVLWPETFLIGVMFAVGLVAVFLGLHELSIAMIGRRRSAGWQFCAAHAGMAVAYGVLTLTAATLPLRWALWATAAWLVAYATLSLTAAAFAGTPARARRALRAWAVAQLVVAVVAVAYPSPNIFALLYFGAVYATMFGTWQLGLGSWLRRLSERHRLAAKDGGADGGVEHRDGQQLAKDPVDTLA